MTTARIGRDTVTLSNVIIEGNTARIVKPEESKTTPAPTQERRYKSVLEEEYALVCQARLLAGEIRSWQYEPTQFKLPGHRHIITADFLLWMQDGTIQIHECKGQWIKNRREGISKLKTLAGITPWATVYLIEKEDGRWVQTLMSRD